MKKQSPEAYDPLLQDKIDQLTQHPDRYMLQYEIDRQVSELESRRREIRAMERECERTEIVIAALRKALKVLENPEEHNKPHEGPKFRMV